MFERIEITAQAFYETIVLPSFQDLVPVTGTFNGILNEFTVMDDVSSQRSIINIRRMQNIMQRRDASCNIVYKKLMGTDARMITTVPLYSATKLCQNEFYQGALEDWRRADPLFIGKMTPWFISATRTDLATNAYFGDITRVANPNAIYSTNMYDGIFKLIRQYYAAGVIPASQGVIMPVVDFRANPAQAYAVLKSLVDRQPELLRGLPEGDKAIYTTTALRDGYREYLRQLGNGDAYTFEVYANGVKVDSIDGIPIYVDPLWSPVMTELYGANYNAAVLTLRGNFVFGTDKTYGEGPNLDEALRIWYNEDEMQWKYRMFMKAGVQIALPEYIVFALPA